jgi:hypothetical protein
VRAARTCAEFALAAAVVALLGAYVRAGADARTALAAEVAVSAELDEAHRIHLDYWARQQQLVRELAAGRVSLADAADDVLEAGLARPSWLRALARNFPGDADDRIRIARVLVTWVRAVTADHPDRHDEAVDRVAAEFDRMTDPADD